MMSLEALLKEAEFLESTLSGLISRKDQILIDHDNNDFAGKVSGRIQSGINRRNDEFISKFYDRKLLHFGTSGLTNQQFASVLKEIGIVMNEDDVKTLFHTVDVNNDGVMNLEEFKRAVRFPSTMESFFCTLPIIQIFADAMPGEMGNDLRLRQFGLLTPEHIDVVCRESMPFVIQVIKDAVEKVRTSFEAMDCTEACQSASKFEVPAEMSAGTINDFFGGLDERIGDPVVGDWWRIMKSEHCDRLDSKVYFHTSNYGITTTPENEWKVTTTRDESLADMRHFRTLPDTEDRARSDIATKAGLILAEVVALVLYTGPMFAIYNAVLRRWPKADSERGNSYTTTIHVLVSAVLKLTRVTKFTEGSCVYRGTGGRLALPLRFCKADDHGCKGFTEWGFMSTTFNKAVALKYSGVKEGRALPTVLEIKVQSIDRGASISYFSQYPTEDEVLFIPTSFLAPEGPAQLEVTIHGIVNVVPVRVNINLSSSTLEALVDRKKRGHLASFHFLIGDLRPQLYQIAKDGKAEERLSKDPTREWSACATLEQIVERIVAKVGDVLELHKSTKIENFTDNEGYKRLVTEMLDAGTMATSVFRLYLEDWNQTIFYVMEMPLQDSHRALVAFRARSIRSLNGEERRLAALRQCQLMGLVVECIDEVSHSGETPIVRVAADGSIGPSCIKLLVEAGANISDGAALRAAATHGHLEAVAALIDVKAGVNSAAVQVVARH